MINKERIEAWVQALESGEHTQICGSLRHREGKTVVGHCVLGIGMLVAEQHGVRVHDSDWTHGVLSPEVATWYGLEPGRTDLLVVRDEDSEELVYVSLLNDRLYIQSLAPVPKDKSNFWKIAQKIRARYLKDDGS